jgi:hypothetical protein
MICQRLTPQPQRARRARGRARPDLERAVSPAAESVARSSDLAAQTSLRSAQALHSTGILVCALRSERVLQQYSRTAGDWNRRIVFSNTAAKPRI